MKKDNCVKNVELIVLTTYLKFITAKNVEDVLTKWTTTVPGQTIVSAITQGSTTFYLTSLFYLEF